MVHEENKWVRVLWLELHGAHTSTKGIFKFIGNATKWAWNLREHHEWQTLPSRPYWKARVPHDPCGRTRGECRSRTEKCNDEQPTHHHHHLDRVIRR